MNDSNDTGDSAGRETRISQREVLHQQALESASMQTKAVRYGQTRSQHGEHSEALYLTSSYIFDDCADAAARFAGDKEGNVYSRYTNPTVANFEKRLAAMEQAEDCVATASGMAAIMSLCLAHLEAGSHIICSRDVFGSTVILLDNFFAKFGVEVTYVGLSDYKAWESACKANTKLFFIETPSNPTCEVGDIALLAKLAHKAGALLAVDNCFCTPVLQQPLALGADLVIHSATKYLDGQGRCLGGAVLGRREIVEPILGSVRSGGACLSPFNAWVLLKSLETLHLRMNAHCGNASELAGWLGQQSWVDTVLYTGLSDHPGHQIARDQQKLFGGVLSFRYQVDGQAATKEQTWQYINATRLLSLTANLGDTKTTIVHPATTTHGRISPAQREAAGISDNLIRIACGIEDIEDIKRDLVQAATA